MKRRVHFLLCGGLMLWFSAASMGQLQTLQEMTPSTQSTQPAAAPLMGQMRQWVAQLGDPSAEVRESARSALFNLHRDDLPVLRRAADAEQPLLPGQMLALREIVRQVFLASEPYETIPGRGMLGLSWPQAGMVDDVTFDVGVIVAERLPGFCAYQMLQPGDVIVKLIDQPEVDLHSLAGFMEAISSMHAGQTLRVRVLRNGQMLDMSLVLNPRPSEIQPVGPQDTQSWLRDRDDKAERYWNEKFGSLAEPMAAASDAPTRQ